MTNTTPYINSTAGIIRPQKSISSCSGAFLFCGWKGGQILHLKVQPVFKRFFLHLINTIKKWTLLFYGFSDTPGLSFLNSLHLHALIRVAIGCTIASFSSNTTAGLCIAGTVGKKSTAFRLLHFFSCKWWQVFNCQAQLVFQGSLFHRLFFDEQYHRR